MKIAIFHPQINNYGGGETVTLTIAFALAKDHNVTILSSDKVDKKKISRFYGLDLQKVEFRVRKVASIIKKLPFLNSYKTSLQVKLINDLNRYDLVIDTGTNGWFTKKLKPKTICYIHYPYFQSKKKGWKKITNNLLVDPKKAFQYDTLICNSRFTKKCLRKLTNKKIEVIYPPVEVSKIKPRKKQNKIVTIGRFTYEKKHEVLIDAFKELYKKNKDYSFHLIGSFQNNMPLYKKEYLDMLKERAKGFPIKFHMNMPHDKVLKFLEDCKIYWHSRGYGETDLNEYENFGITTVEAMAAGCVPIVINLGAQPEIVEHGKNGYCWNEPKELLDYTKNLIENINLYTSLKIEAIKKSKKYDTQLFINRIRNIVQAI